jgi:hypothetical protein
MPKVPKAFIMRRIQTETATRVCRSNRKVFSPLFDSPHSFLALAQDIPKILMDFAGYDGSNYDGW